MNDISMFKTRIYEETNFESIRPYIKAFNKFGNKLNDNAKSND